ncbi:SMI1/KNR4 family protein [Shewanella sp. 202IG2-18]|uniref:SMI1/KNR4 family protein n=1 Tax=Parashewanella hymeniacidonis TaxID=2807618 RepID=UPI0019615743|nr:SMI1/KNR4 family protein [Parashewanella hymeniacidonis]MBM7072330.1 SMI1/KNR4 family protein [Parashewanella hymeniacidonis]
MNDIIDQLQDASIETAFPLVLPTFEQLVEVEEQILIPLPGALKEYLLEASDVIFGNVEPVTAADPSSHTFLPEVTSYAWSIGLPRDQIAICQVGDNFHCIDQQGEVRYWQNGRFTEHWEHFWLWAEEVWLAM